MTKLKIISDFPYYHGGCNRVDYEAGQVVEIDDEEMIEVAIDQGWAENEEATKPQHKGKDK